MGGLKIELSRRGGAVVVKLIGSAGLAEAGVLDAQVQHLTAEKPALVVCDLGQLSFMSSVGITALITLHNALKDQGGSVRLVAPTPMVGELLQQQHLSEILPVFGTLEAAIAGTAPKPGRR